MCTQIFYFIFLTFVLKFINRADSHNNIQFRKFFPTYLRSQNTTNKISNTQYDDTQHGALNWKSERLNPIPSARSTLAKINKDDHKYLSKKHTVSEHRFKPILTDNVININPFLTHQYSRDLDLKLEDYNIELKPEDSVTTVKPSTVRRSRTHAVTDSTIHIQTWEPDELSTRRFQIQAILDEDMKINLRHNDHNMQTLPDSYSEHKKKVCKQFIPSKMPFEYEKMENIWQTMYYRLPDTITCFQILIRKVPYQQREAYQRKYGNFGGAVDWENVRLEISATTNIGRKHFLQGKNEDLGVMYNIIISRDVETGELLIQEESPDQWLVVGHMLLMRDCETGGVVVFARVPYVPRRREIEDALAKIHENYGSGKLSCDEDEVISKSFEVEEDIQSFWNN